MSALSPQTTFRLPPSCLKFLKVLQMIFFLVGRLFDDISWQQYPISIDLLEALSFGLLLASALLLFFSKVRDYPHKPMVKLLLIDSQIKFLVPWSLVILSSILFFHIFGCKSELPQHTSGDELLQIDNLGCWLALGQMITTNLNYSLACNHLTNMPMLALYETVLFGEIIYNGNVILSLIRHESFNNENQGILFFVIIVDANQILIMDILFRVWYEMRIAQERREDIVERIEIEEIKAGAKARVEVIGIPLYRN